MQGERERQTEKLNMMQRGCFEARNTSILMCELVYIAISFHRMNKKVFCILPRREKEAGKLGLKKIACFEAKNQKQEINNNNNNNNYIYKTH